MPATLVLSCFVAASEIRPRTHQKRPFWEKPQLAKTNLAKLLSRATAAASEAPDRSAAAERSSIDLPEEGRCLVAEMTGLGVLEKAVSKRLGLVKDRVTAIAWAVFTAEFWRTKQKPANPKLVIRDAEGKPDHDALYQVRDQLSLAQYQSFDSVVSALVWGDADTALEIHQARQLVANEIQSDPCLRMRYTLTELAEGHTQKSATGQNEFIAATDAEQVLAEKILAFLMAAPDKKGKVTRPGLTTDERAFLLVKDARLAFRDPKGFFARVHEYATTLEQLRHILGCFSPVHFFSPMHFAVSDSQPQRQDRLLDVARTVLGTAGKDC
jgi:hypothetical protein